MVAFQTEVRFGEGDLAFGSDQQRGIRLELLDEFFQLFKPVEDDVDLGSGCRSNRRALLAVADQKEVFAVGSDVVHPIGSGVQELVYRKR